MSGMRRGGRHARASSALRARGRRAHETRRDGRATTTSTCTARVDGARDGAPVAFGLGSADGERDPTTRSRDAVTRHRDPAKARPTRARTAETRTVDARGVQKSRGFLRGRHPPLRACLRWTGASESGGRTSARAVATNCRLFSLGKCNRLVLHQKLQNNGSLVDKKCEIGLKKTRHVRSNLPEARKSVSVLARKHRVQRRRRVYGANFHQSVRRAANARVRVIGRVVRA